MTLNLIKLQWHTFPLSRSKVALVTLAHQRDAEFMSCVTTGLKFLLNYGDRLGPGIFKGPRNFGRSCALGLNNCTEFYDYTFYYFTGGGKRKLFTLGCSKWRWKFNPWLTREPALPPIPRIFQTNSNSTIIVYSSVRKTTKLVGISTVNGTEYFERSWIQKTFEAAAVMSSCQAVEIQGVKKFHGAFHSRGGRL